MTNWTGFSEAAPELASAVVARLDAHKHHVLATVRADGSPRVSGTEIEIFEGRLILGSMIGAVKARDLQRRPQFALHANPGHHSMEGGDAKIAGTAAELVGPAKDAVTAHYPPEIGECHVFELDLTEVVLTTAGETELTITSWRPVEGVRVFTR